MKCTDRFSGGVPIAPFLIFKVNRGLQDQEKLFSRPGHAVILGTEWEDPPLT